MADSDSSKKGPTQDSNDPERRMAEMDRRLAKVERRYVTIKRFEVLDHRVDHIAGQWHRKEPAAIGALFMMAIDCCQTLEVGRRELRAWIWMPPDRKFMKTLTITYDNIKHGLRELLKQVEEINKPEDESG